MATLDRRRFLQISSLGLGTLISPAVLSRGIEPWQPNPRRYHPGRFLHGVASGDPLNNAVILWTRVTPMDEQRPGTGGGGDAGPSREILVGWEVATDPAFDQLVRRGAAVVGEDSDYTLKVDAAGLLPGTTYFYRFSTINRRSPVGVTRTLPAGSVQQVKLAVMSCANYPAGYFNAYQDASLIPDLDAVVHVGDYIYEYGDGEYATELADLIGRGFEPGNDTELLTLQDYRARYAQYHTDRGLQNLHAAAPFICVWDDHEVADNTWKAGAANHNPGEGDFTERKQQALRAYFEWMPIRPVIENNHEIIYRGFEFGDLVDLIMLDTRVVGRDQQLDYANYIAPTGEFNAAQFIADLSDVNRTLLGFEQRGWLQNRLATSAATWQVLGQQVLLGRMSLPAELLLNLADPAAALGLFQELAQIKARMLAGDPTVTDLERARVLNALPYNLDAWDGYAVEREIVLGTARTFQRNLVVLAGDTHNGWANDLRDLQGNPVGVEFAGPGVTSPGLEDILSLDPALYPLVEAGFELLIDDLRYLNVGDRGYLTVTFTPGAATAEWQYVDNILSEQYALLEQRARSLQVVAGTNRIAS